MAEAELGLHRRMHVTTYPTVCYKTAPGSGRKKARKRRASGRVSEWIMPPGVTVRPPASSLQKQVVHAEHVLLLGLVVGPDDLDRQEVAAFSEVERAEVDLVRPANAVSLEQVDDLAGLLAVDVELDLAVVRLPWSGARSRACCRRPWHRTPASACRRAWPWSTTGDSSLLQPAQILRTQFPGLLHGLEFLTLDRAREPW